MATESLASKLQVKHAEMMRFELEAVALRLFEAHGFGDVTVDRIASEAGISARTFYRYFPAKEDVFQVRIDERTDALRAAILAVPPDEPPVHAVRLAFEAALRDEDPELVRRWTSVIAETPSVLMGVIGGIQLKAQPAVAELIGSRLGQPSDALEPAMMAAAVGGVVQASQTRWFLQGGDLAATISEGLEVLERGFGTTTATARTPSHKPAKRAAVKAR